MADEKTEDEILLEKIRGRRRAAGEPVLGDLNLTTEHETSDSWPDLAIRMVRDWAVEGLGVPGDTGFYVVWFCFILGGWKALVSSTEADGRYYEVTFNKIKDEAYIDTYLKTHNQMVKVEVNG